jgi:molybdopterin-biosynthesis enzyme MoeA-like protein
MGIVAIVIGDEIIRGKRGDKHFPRLIEILAARGMRLGWCQYLGDNPELITATFRRTLASEDIVSARRHRCDAGRSHPPVPRTRWRGAGVAPGRRPRSAAPTGNHAAALKMGEFPRGSKIIPNPCNRIRVSLEITISCRGSR